MYSAIAEYEDSDRTRSPISTCCREIYLFFTANFSNVHYYCISSINRSRNASFWREQSDSAGQFYFGVGGLAFWNASRRSLQKRSLLPSVHLLSGAWSRWRWRSLARSPACGSCEAVWTSRPPHPCGMAATRRRRRERTLYTLSFILSCIRAAFCFVAGGTEKAIIVHFPERLQTIAEEPEPSQQQQPTHSSSMAERSSRVSSERSRSSARTRTSSRSSSPSTPIGVLFLQRGCISHGVSDSCRGRHYRRRRRELTGIRRLWRRRHCRRHCRTNTTTTSGQNGHSSRHSWQTTSASRAKSPQ